MKEIYNKQYYDLHVKRFLRKNYFVKKKMERVMNMINPKKEDNILEIGCGMGKVTIECTKKGAKATGIDYSREAIRLANELNKKFGNNKGIFKEADCTNLPLKKNIFNKVVCADLVEHIYPKDYLKMLKEVKRVLKDKGKLIIYTPSPTYITEIMRANNFILKQNKGHIHLKSMGYLLDTLKDNGFSIEKAVYFSNSLNPFTDSIEEVLRKTPLINKYFERRIGIIAVKNGTK